MNIEQAKDLNLADFLYKIGFQGKKIGHNFWYKSPFRDERTPSFSVHATESKWYDWGDGTGGNIIDFGIRYFHCSVSDFLKELDKHYHGISITRVQNPVSPQKENEEPEIKILDVKPLHSYPLLRYLQERRIRQTIADKYCKEVSFELRGKTYYSIGFKNASGGYALRNAYAKQACMPNDISLLTEKDAKDLAVFEGFFDFLSYKTMYHNQQEPKRNFLILNSTSFFEQSLPIMQEYHRVHLFLDNDKTGDKCIAQATELDKEKFRDERAFYKNHNDLNDFLRHIGQAQKPRLNQKL